MILTEEQYLALVSLARQGAPASRVLMLDQFLREIEKANNITRHILWVQYQEADSPPSPVSVGQGFPEKFPPETRFLLERTDRPIAKSDVSSYLAQVARKPITVLVTKDPQATYGWTEFEVMFP